MKDYEVKSSVAVFNEKIRIPETTDTNHADNINAAPKLVYENTIANRREIEALKKKTIPVVFSETPPEIGPTLWFCTDPAWRPEPEVVATAILGDPSGADDADVTGEVNEIVYPVLNATVSEEDGNVIATIEQS